MGDMADMYADMYDERGPVRTRTKACIRCKKTGLIWKQIDYGSSIKWRLADKKTGEVHVCEEPKARGGLKPKK